MKMSPISLTSRFLQFQMFREQFSCVIEWQLVTTDDNQREQDDYIK